MKRRRSNWLLLVGGILMLMFALGRLGSGFLGGGTGVVPEPDCSAAINWDDAQQYVGESVTVRGPVVGTAYLTEIGGQPTFLNVGRDHPDPGRFTVVIWNDVRSQFDQRPEALFAGAEICVEGEVQEHEGSPQIELDGPRAIRMAD